MTHPCFRILGTESAAQDGTATTVGGANVLAAIPFQAGGGSGGSNGGGSGNGGGGGSGTVAPPSEIESVPCGANSSCTLTTPSQYCLNGDHCVLQVRSRCSVGLFLQPCWFGLRHHCRSLARSLAL